MVADGRSHIGPARASDADPPNQGRRDIGAVSVVTPTTRCIGTCGVSPGASGTLRRPTLAGEPFEQAFANALDALR
jgi:hypothetical protein